MLLSLRYFNVYDTMINNSELSADFLSFTEREALVSLRCEEVNVHNFTINNK